MLLCLVDRIGISRPAVTCACLLTIATVFKVSYIVAIVMTARRREELVHTVIDKKCMRCCKEAPEYAAMVLLHMSRSMRAQKMSGPLVDAMAVALVEAVVKAPELCSPTFFVGMCLLFKHFDSVAAHRGRLMAAGALGAVVAGMRKFGNQASVQQTGCEALVAMCPREEPRNVALAVAAGATEVVDAAAAAFPETTHSDVAKAAAAALEMLTHAPGPAPAAGGAGS